ncbi:MAG: hypothetical protein ACK5L7_03640 [Paludibacteraceae bacterium]
MNKIFFLLTLFLSISFSEILQAQVTIGSNVEPDGNAILDLKNNANPETSTKGLLLPRMELESTALATPLTAHVKGMVVYNTKTANNVTPGYYYNDGTKWVRIADAAMLGTEPWYNVATNTDATTNTQNIYQMGKVGIGANSPTNQLQVTAAADPLRLVGVQTTTDTEVLTIDNNGIVHKKTELDGDPTNEIELPTSGTAGDIAYWNGTAWITVPAGNEGQVLTFVSGVPTWKTQLEDGEVENPTTGKIWMDRNLGATQVATSSTDAASYGDLYQWGRAADGHQIRTSATTTILATSDTPGHDNFITNGSSPYDWRNPQNDDLWQGVNGTNNPCPSGFRLPTEAEWNAEHTSWSSNNAAGALASPLKLPLAGHRNYSSGALGNVGSYSYYWSSTVNGTLARILYFYSGHATMYSSNRTYGFSVRCIKN